MGKCKKCGTDAGAMMSICFDCATENERSSSASVRKLYHPVNGATEDIHKGFSWPCFFFGVFWFLYKRMWGWAIISAIISVMTYGVAILIFPFFANKLYADSLIKSGYLNEKQWAEKNNQVIKPQESTLQATEQVTIPQEPTSQATVPLLIADELLKLVALRDNGILSTDEFERQKQKLLT